MNVKANMHDKLKNELGLWLKVLKFYKITVHFT